MVDESLVDEIREVKEAFEKTNADIKLVKDENLHFTVKFLGEIEEGGVEKVDRVKGVLDNFDPFQIELKGTGAFPSKDYIKVVWIGVGKGREKFKEMLELIDETLSREGFEREKNEPVPHLTIGRVKSGKNKDRIVSKLQKFQGKEMGGMEVNKVTLFESNLTSEGPVYKKLKQYRL